MWIDAYMSVSHDTYDKTFRKQCLDRSLDLSQHDRIDSSEPKDYRGGGKKNGGIDEHWKKYKEK
jgi:hypothetical protein